MSKIILTSPYQQDSRSLRCILLRIQCWYLTIDKCFLIQKMIRFVKWLCVVCLLKWNLRCCLNKCNLCTLLQNHVFHRAMNQGIDVCFQGNWMYGYWPSLPGTLSGGEECVVYFHFVEFQLHAGVALNWEKGKPPGSLACTSHIRYTCN